MKKQKFFSSENIYMLYIPSKVLFSNNGKTISLFHQTSLNNEQKWKTLTS